MSNEERLRSLDAVRALDQWTSAPQETLQLEAFHALYAFVNTARLFPPVLVQDVELIQQLCSAVDSQLTSLLDNAAVNLSDFTVAATQCAAPFDGVDVQTADSEVRSISMLLRQDVSEELVSVLKGAERCCLQLRLTAATQLLVGTYKSVGLATESTADTEASRSMGQRPAIFSTAPCAQGKHKIALGPLQLLIRRHVPSPL